MRVDQTFIHFALGLVARRGYPRMSACACRVRSACFAPMDWNRFERQVLSGTRLLTLVAVVSSFAGALLMTYLGLINTLDAFHIQLGGVKTELPNEEATIVVLIGALDRFLIAIVLLFFGYGIYTLFVRPDSTPSDLGLPRWLHVERIGQLKQTLAEVIIVVLFVLFLRVALETFVASDPDLSWLDAGKFLLLPLAILLLAWALKLAELHPKHGNGGQPPPEGARRERVRSRDSVD